MVIALLIGLSVGFMLAMPPGPVGVTAIKLGLSKGLRPGVELSLGTGLMDFFFCLAAMFATSAAGAAVGTFSDDYPRLMLFVQVGLILTFVIYGIVSVRAKGECTESLNTDIKSDSKLITYLKGKGPFLLGIAIALTNIPNPTFLPTLAAISAYVLKSAYFPSTALNSLIFSIGFGIGNFAWLYVLVRLVTKYKSKISPQLMIRIKQFAGVTFIGFGTLLGYRLVSMHKIPELIRLLFVF